MLSSKRNLETPFTRLIATTTCPASRSTLIAFTLLPPAIETPGASPLMLGWFGSDSGPGCGGTVHKSIVAEVGIPGENCVMPLIGSTSGDGSKSESEDVQNSEGQGNCRRQNLGSSLSYPKRLVIGNCSRKRLKGTKTLTQTINLQVIDAKMNKTVDLCWFPDKQVFNSKHA
jgi:hypothetical protein